MEVFKTLAVQAQNLHFAANRQIELIERNGSVDKQMLEMIENFAHQISETVNSMSTSAARIAPEQINADKTFLASLEASLTGYQEELVVIEKELIDQAIIDSKAGEKSTRYTALEKRERDLKQAIKEANTKLGKVTERIPSPAFSNAVNQIVNEVKP
jgi:hypothetical protein